MEGRWLDNSGAEDEGVTDLETARLCRALIEAGKTFRPLDRAQRDAMFQRIVARLREDEKRGIPVARIERPSGLVHSAKLSG